MKKSKKIALAIFLSAAFLAGMSPVADLLAAAPSPFLDGQWVATADWLGCDQNSAARECAEWTTDSGSMVLTCCVPTSALGTKDLSACTDGGQVRGRTDL